MKLSSFRNILIVGALAIASGLPLAVLSPRSAEAVGETATVGALSATGSANRFTFPVSISGFTSSKSFTVVISASSGLLDLPVRTGLTSSAGYPALTASATELGFYGTHSAVQAALASIGYTMSSPAAATTIDVSISEYAGANFSYNPDNGHYYEYVNVSQAGAPAATSTLSGISEYSWTDAKTYSEARTLFGRPGYLATITSNDENQFLMLKSNSINVWIGAGRKSITTSDSTASSDGLIWEWKTGPEAGQAFARQYSNNPQTFPQNASGATSINSAFFSWASNEPNNYQYPGWTAPSGLTISNNWLENYAVLNWGSVNGQWNDLPDRAMINSFNVPYNAVPGFLVEYGDATPFTVENAIDTESLSFVTLDKNDGTGTPPTSLVSVIQSSSTSLPTSVFSRNGYTFGGWATSRLGSAVYTEGQAVSVTNPVSLYALWTPLVHNVTFDSQSGSSVSASTYQTGGSVSTSAVPTRSGYTFNGWFTAPSGGTALPSTYSPSGYGDITLFAQWTAIGSSQSNSVAELPHTGLPVVKYGLFGLFLVFTGISFFGANLALRRNFEQ